MVTNGRKGSDVQPGRRQTFCAAKKEAHKKYANCDFCQMDHNLVLMRAATARITRTLPIQADGLFERERVYSSYRRCWWYHCEVYSHSSLGKKSIGLYEMEMHFFQFEEHQAQAQEGNEDPNWYWVGKQVWCRLVWYSGHRELSFYFVIRFSCFAPAQQQSWNLDMITILILFGEEHLCCNCLLITNSLLITLPLHSQVPSVLDHVFGSYFQNQEHWH